MEKPQTDVISEFKQALLINDKKLMRSYVTEGVELPNFQTNKQIHAIKIVPSPKEDTTILISYSKNTDDEFTIGYILEIVTKNNKISQINQIYDGTNPLMKEATIVKEYKMKCKEHILTPTKFPYELIFQKSGFQYTIAIGNKRYIKGKYSVKDLIQIAESMN